MKKEITVKANKKKRTFTIRKNQDGMRTKYRTLRFSKPEFEEMEYNTESDWQAFLRESDTYYIVH